MSLMPPQKIKEAVKQLKASESRVELPPTHSKMFLNKNPTLSKFNSTSQSYLRPPFQKASLP